MIGMFGLRWRAAVVAIALAASAAILYGRRLDDAPPHLEIDEVLIALDAQSVAATGHDVRGERLPLYFPVGATSWYQPIIVYLTALVLKVAPLSEASIRVPTVLVAIANIVLIFLVARRLFDSDWFGCAAAVLLASTPGHFIHARYGMDYLYPAPFVLGWLLCLLSYVEHPRSWVLLAAMCVLGVGFYSYIASILLMPAYFLLTCVVLFLEGAPGRTYGLAAAGFLPWLVPFFWWLTGHPRAFDATITKYALFDVEHLNAIQGVRSLISYASVSERVSRYWNFFNPAFLLFGSGIKMPFSTNLVGVFLLPFAVLWPLGIFYALTRRASPILLVLCLGFVIAPLGAVIVAEENAIFRGLTILPFGVLLATAGLYYLWGLPVRQPLAWVYVPIGVAAMLGGAAYGLFSVWTRSGRTTSSIPLIAGGAAILGVGAWLDRRKEWRIAAIGLLLLIPVQFGSFLSDYFSDYRTRSAIWLGGNIRGAVEEILLRDSGERVPFVYLSPMATAGQVDDRTTFTDAYWRFYLAKYHRTDLLDRTRRFEPSQVGSLPVRSLILASADDKTTQALVERGDLHLVRKIQELDGTTFFQVLQR
jgi:4-amino-4-deoxy-L-arabinose transferase-like glycosyltransferase